MEAEDSEEAELMRRLRDSRWRFQRRMQQLIEKYNHPFEDTPVVEMATLTYQTPEGLRLWGGGLIQERSPGEIQVEGSPVSPLSWIDGRGRDASEDSKNSNVDATFNEKDKVTVTVTPVVLLSPLKNELRRKYLTQVDKLLEHRRCSELADIGGQESTQLTPIPPLTKATHGDCSDVSANNPGGPLTSASSLGEHDPSAHSAVGPRSDSLLLQEASNHSLFSNQPPEARDVCDVTISDLYEGMLHSMSQLLSARPSCVISTKTFIAQNWGCRWRPRWKSRLNRTYCRGGRHSQRGSRGRHLPFSEPSKQAATLSSPKNSLEVSCPETAFQLKKALREVNSPQVRELVPSWKELKVTPQKGSLLTDLDSGAVYDLDQENRFRKLKWLISPVKVMSKSRMLQGLGVNRHREIEVRFDRVHQECCLRPWSQPCSPRSWALDVYRGGHGLQGLEAHHSSIRVLPKLREHLEKVGVKSLEGSGCLPLSDFSSLLLSKPGPAQNTGRAEQIPDSILHRSSLGMFRRSLPPTKAISKPSIQSLGCGRNHYDNIKERFDKLHQEYCQRSPQQGKETFCTKRPLDKASTGAQYKKGILRKMTADSAFQSPQKSLSFPQRIVKSPSDSTVIELYPLTGIIHAPGRDRQSPSKRRRLSDPQMYEWWAEPWTNAGMGRAIPRPGEESHSLQLDLEEKDGRKK